jgi:hypothetical protein
MIKRTFPIGSLGTGKTYNFMISRNLGDCNDIEKIIIQYIRELPEHKKAEVLDFIDFI